MNRLFWRIFFAFWSVIIVAALLGGLLSALIMREKLADTRFETLSRVLPALAAEAQSALRAGGETGLADWLASRQQDSPGMLLVLRADGSELLGRPLPPWFQRRLQRGGAGPPGLTGRPPPAVTLQGPAGQRYRLVLLPPRPPRGGLFAAPPSRALFLLLLLAGSVVACYLLARYLVRPVLALRAAGRRIAAGDLAARLDPRSLARRDEIGALARDFNRMAERIQRLVEGQQQLLRDVSHELRSPLARMELAVGLLERQGAQATPDTLERVRCEVRRLDELIGRLLAYSRLLGGGEAQRTAVPLAELARAAVADADYEAQAAGRCVQLDLRAEPVIDGDARLLHSAIDNLLRNAVRHARSRVELQLAQEEGDAVLTVRDDGQGMPADLLERATEPFVAGPDGGAGIGLAIAAAAARRHGGELRLTNRPDGGLCAELRLPLVSGGGGEAH